MLLLGIGKTLCCALPFEGCSSLVLVSPWPFCSAALEFSYSHFALDRSSIRVPQIDFGFVLSIRV
jgi:hypothetical protein